MEEWTQEQQGISYRVVRGGYYDYDGGNFPVAYRDYYYPNCDYSSTDHCKIALIVSKHRQRERTLKFQNSSFFFIYFLIGVDIKMQKNKKTTR